MSCRRFQCPAPEAPELQRAAEAAPGPQTYGEMVRAALNLEDPQFSLGLDAAPATNSEGLEALARLYHAGLQSASGGRGSSGGSGGAQGRRRAVPPALQQPREEAAAELALEEAEVEQLAPAPEGAAAWEDAAFPGGAAPARAWDRERLAEQDWAEAAAAGAAGASAWGLSAHRHAGGATELF